MNAIGQTVAAATFNILVILLLPIMIIGYVIWIGKGLLSRNQTGISGTAQGSLSARYFEHNLGTRRDEVANQLMKALPGVPPLGLSMVASPILLGHRLTGFVPRAFRYPFEGEVSMIYQASARQTFFDAVVDRYLGKITQFVILGAGFDTRAYRLPWELHVRSFEVDTRQTQAIKRELLEKVHADLSGTKFLAADFEKEDWLAMLVDESFNLEEPALFLLEGVMVYLDADAVKRMLHKIASTAKGSILAFDYFTTEPLESKALYWRYARIVTKAAGEPMKFGVDSTPPSSAHLNELLQSCGLSLLQQHVLGLETGKKHAWGGFAIAVVE